MKHAIAPAVHKTMISMINLSPAFSLLMDESTDRGVVKREGIMMNPLYTLQLAFGAIRGSRG